MVAQEVVDAAGGVVGEAFDLVGGVDVVAGPADPGELLAQDRAVNRSAPPATRSSAAQVLLGGSGGGGRDAGTHHRPPP